jgi:hypothetical protein
MLIEAGRILILIEVRRRGKKQERRKEESGNGYKKRKYTLNNLPKARTKSLA